MSSPAPPSRIAIVKSWDATIRTLNSSTCRGILILFHGGSKGRKGHFFNAASLRSQFDTLEIPKDALVVDISRTPQEIVQTIIGEINPHSERKP